MNEPELTQGSQGEWVTYLQQLLEQAGYLTESADGDFGPATDSAVRAYQSDSGLDADGIVGDATWEALTATSGGEGESTETSDDTSGGAAETSDDTGEAAETSDDTGEAAESSEGEVPSELVEAGAPADLSQWTDEQKEAFFEGTITDEVNADTPEEVPLLAMADGPDEEEGGVIA
jgi:peptidoglycan hydrolase-like protein with peptidoglycan-binding domain